MVGCCRTKAVTITKSQKCYRERDWGLDSSMCVKIEPDASVCDQNTVSEFTGCVRE